MGRRLETLHAGSLIKGDSGMEPMRLRQVTGTSPEGGNAGDNARWPGMEMTEWSGASENKCSVVQGV